jgi:hypothetical protein
MFFFILRPVKLLFYTVVCDCANPYFLTRRWHPPHERGHDPRTAQVAAGGRFVYALQASVFCGVVGLCEGSVGLSHSL